MLYNADKQMYCMLFMRWGKLGHLATQIWREHANFINIKSNHFTWEYDPVKHVTQEAAVPAICCRFYCGDKEQHTTFKCSLRLLSKNHILVKFHH